MDMGLLFWIIMILCILSYVGTWAQWQGPWMYGSNAITLILFGLLGWKVFGPILK